MTIQKMRDKDYYQKNRDKILAKKKKYYNANKEVILKKDAIRREDPKVKKRNAENGKKWRADNPNYKAPNDKESRAKYRLSEKGQITEKVYSEKYKPRKKELDKLRREDAEWVEKDREWHKQHSKKPEVIERRRELDNIRSKKDSIKKSLRTLLYNALSRFTDEGKVHKSSKYGVDYKNCIIKLEEESQSYGYTVKEMREMNYHIDHIIPMNEYNFKKKKDIARCFNPLNLRWLLGEENSVKSDRIRPEDLEIIKTLPQEIYPEGFNLEDYNVLG